MTKDVYCLCEGFSDRDFLAGWFEHAKGWRDPTGGGKRTILPPFANESLPKGSFVFEAPGRSRVCIVPCGGRPSLGALVADWLLEEKELVAMGYSGLMLCADVDRPAGDPADTVVDLARQAAVQAGRQLPKDDPPWSWPNLQLEVVSMRAGVLGIEGLPTNESLERVVVAAFARAHPRRFEALRNWMRGRPEPVEANGKETAWSIMAAWFAEDGCSDFLRRGVWQDERMCAELEQVLAATRLPDVTARLEA